MRATAMIAQAPSSCAADRHRFQRPLGTLLGVLIPLASVWLQLPALAQETSLSAYWATHAQPEGEYDLVVDLDSLAVYVGSFYLTNGQRNCIRGHGAILKLTAATIRVVGTRTGLDLQNCVIIDGGRYEGSTGCNDPAVYYGPNCYGEVKNCVFYGNLMGLFMRAPLPGEGMRVTNCIFMASDDWGAMMDDINPGEIMCSAAYNNAVDPPPSGGGDFGYWCGCGSIPPFLRELPPESMCIYADPLFVAPSIDPAVGDFHLAEGSPCRGTGEPPGTHMGAYQDDVSVVQAVTWGRIKASFRSRGAR